MALSIIGNNILNIIFYVCFIASIGVLYLSPSLFNAAVVALYIVMLAYNLFFKVKKYGLITTRHGEPLPFTMVGVYPQSDQEKRAAFAISDILGRYFVLAKDDRYTVKIQGKKLEGQPFKKILGLNIRDGVLRRDIQVEEDDFIL